MPADEVPHWRTPGWIAAQAAGAAEAAMSRPRGLGPGATPLETSTVLGMTFRRTTGTEGVDWETYTADDGRVVLHQSRQDGTWLGREPRVGSLGFSRHDSPGRALGEVLERRAREAAAKRPDRQIA